ncbi:MAG: hypothetical protein ACXV3C_15395 [Actinomycetes bacterium]
MTSTDPARDGDPVPDSGMDTGSDAGEPGDHLGGLDLTPDEERLLAELERDAVDAPTDAPEDSDAAFAAAEDETPLPDEGGAQDDGLSPRFSSPE